VTIRGVLVDDQPLLRTGFRMILHATDDVLVVGEAADGGAAVTQVAELEPDVVLMDIRMPGMDGVEATRRIVASGSTSRVLILTTFDLDEYAFAGLRAGASGFLLKDVPPAELTSAIRAVASGDAVVSPRITRELLDRYASSLPRSGGEATPAVHPIMS
jgi:DNA-binding NarL/FixJ family response regulator